MTLLRRCHSFWNKLKFSHKGVWLVYGVVLDKGYKIDVFSLIKLCDVPEIQGKCVICGKSDDQWSLIAQMSLCTKCYGSVKDPRGNFGKGISCARGNDHGIGLDYRSDLLRLGNGGHNRSGADVLGCCKLILGFAKSGVGGAKIKGAHGVELVILCHFGKNSKYLGKCTK